MTDEMPKQVLHDVSRKLKLNLERHSEFISGSKKQFVIPNKARNLFQNNWTLMDFTFRFYPKDILRNQTDFVIKKH